MQSTCKRFLVPSLLLFAMGAMAQTVTNEHVAAVQANPAATSAPAQLDGSAALFMNHLQNQRLRDRAFMKSINANLTLPHAASMAVQDCEPFTTNGCTDGLFCCDCLVPPGPVCETRTQCTRDCSL
jgi:hypothetical protein